MAYLSHAQLLEMNLKKLGTNVLISDKASIYKADQIEIGDNSRIDDFCAISGRVKIGRNVHISAFCSVSGGTEGICLDDFSGLAYGCHVFSQSDDYTGLTLTNLTVPPELKKEKRGRVHIGRHCIIGANSVVFPGVIMAEGCALGAMSLLATSTEPWAMYFGTPARRIWDRKKDMLRLEEKYLKNEQ
jgi:acetyltransferase-like isoleucine patch superfamily enzyme